MLFSRIEKLIILLHSLLKDTDKNALVAVPIVIGMVDWDLNCPGGGSDSYRNGRGVPIESGFC